MGKTLSLTSKVMLAAFASLTLISCTKKSNTGKVSVKFPQISQATLNRLSNPSASTTSSSGWGVADPVDNSDIICYAVMIGGADLPVQKVCSNSAGAEVARVGAFHGAYLGGKSVSIDVPTGKRTIYIVGFGAASTAACTDFRVTGGPQKSLLSAPHIIAQASKEIVEGENELNITADIDGATKFDSCVGDMDTDRSTAPALTLVSPAATAVVNSTNRSAFPVSGTCLRAGAAVNISITDGTNTATGSATCIAGAWGATVNLLSPVGVADGSITVSATHGAAVVSRVVTKDTTPPVAFTITGAKGGTDTVANTYLTAATPGALWTASTGAVRYGAKIRDLNNLGDVCAVEYTTAVDFTFDASCALALTDGQSYRINVFAEDAAGNQIFASNNNLSFMVDRTAPTAPSGIVRASPFYALNGSPNFSWTAGADSGSGLAIQKIAIGTAAGGDNVVGWTEIAAANTAYQKLTGLSLSHGTTYHFTLKAKDNAGHWSTAATSTWVAQLSPFGSAGHGSLTLAATSNINQIDDTFVGRTLAAHRRITAVDGATRRVLTLSAAFTSSDFAINDEVVWHVLHESSAGSCGGAITAGQYKFGKITAVNGATPSITINEAMDATAPTNLGNLPYLGGTACVIQVVRVPNFEHLTVNSSALLSASSQTYDHGGGLLAIRVAGTLTVNGLISANTYGYTGGGVNTSLQSGGNGDSFVAVGTNNSTSANGSGGGGTGQNTGGAGGGGNAGVGGNGAGYTQAGAGGGRSPGCNGSTCLAGNIFHGGGGGGTYGSSSGTSGGAGGGIIIIYAKTLAGTGVISAKGQNGLGCSGDGKGAGGGAGGTVVLKTHSDNFTGQILTTAGSGSACTKGGGGGGGGAIHQFTCSANNAGVTVSVAGGAGGTGSASGGAGTAGYSNSQTSIPNMCNIL